MENTNEKSSGFTSGQKEFTLSDGRKVVIREGRGSDSEEAMIISGGEGKAYLTALMAQCVTIDGNPIVMEDLKAMKLKDYTKIQSEFAELNF